MKFNKFLAMGAAAAVLTVGIGAHQAQAVTDTLDVDAVIVEAIVLDCHTPLDFGNLDSAAAGVVTVTTIGGRSSTTPSNLVAGGSHNAGVCGLDGEDGLVVDLNIPDGTLDNTTTPGDTLAVDNYTLAGTAVAGGPNDWDVTLQAGGSEDLDIGADLTIAGGEDPGIYQEVLTITATYQ